MQYKLLVAAGKCLIMTGLNKKTLRYGELKTDIAQISERMLTLQLRELEDDGIIKRTVLLRFRYVESMN